MNARGKKKPKNQYWRVKHIQERRSAFSTRVSASISYSLYIHATATTTGGLGRHHSLIAAEPFLADRQFSDDRIILVDWLCTVARKTGATPILLQPYICGVNQSNGADLLLIDLFSQPSDITEKWAYHPSAQLSPAAQQTDRQSKSLDCRFRPAMSHRDVEHRPAADEISRAWL